MLSLVLTLTFRSQEIATLKSLQKLQDMSDILPQKEGNWSFCFILS